MYQSLRYHVLQRQTQKAMYKIILYQTLSSKTTSYSDIFHKSVNVAKDEKPKQTKKNDVDEKIEIETKFRDEGHSLYFYNISNDVSSLEDYDINNHVIYKKKKKKKRAKNEHPALEKALAEYRAAQKEKRDKHYKKRSGGINNHGNEKNEDSSVTKKNKKKGQQQQQQLEIKPQNGIKYNPHSLHSIFLHTIQKQKERDEKLEAREMRQYAKTRPKYYYGCNRLRNRKNITSGHRKTIMKENTSTYIVANDNVDEQEDIDNGLKVALQSIFDEDRNTDSMDTTTSTKLSESLLAVDASRRKKLDHHKFISSKSNITPAFKI